MSLSAHEQFKEALTNCRSVAVVFRTEWNGDSLGTALAMARFIEKQGKPVELICSNFRPHPNFSFLPDIHKVKPSLTEARRLILRFNLDRAKLQGLTYQIKDQHLDVILTPKEGAFDPAAMQPLTDVWKHDLIVAIDTPDFPALGELYNQHRAFFEETPIINIDHNPENERYGSIHFVDMRASSCAEICLSVIEALDAKCLDADTSTCLLTGFISKTKSFKTPNVTPATLTLAGRLIEHGARRAEIIEKLFRTRPVEALRLWGRALARLKIDPAHKMVWSLLGRSDFMHAGCDATHLPDVIDELIASSPEAEIICLIHEDPLQDGKVCVLLATEKARDALQLTAPWNPTGHHRLSRFSVTGVPIATLERQMVDHLRAQL